MDDSQDRLSCALGTSSSIPGCPSESAKLAPVDAKCPSKTMALRMEVMLCTQDRLSGPSGCCSPGQGGEAGGRCIQAGPRGPERPESEESPHQVRACHRDLGRTGRQLPGLTELGSINCGYGREKCAHLLWDVSPVTGFFLETDPLLGASLVAQMVKNPPAM